MLPGFFLYSLFLHTMWRKNAKRTALLHEETRKATGASLNYRRCQMWGGPQVRLDMYSISLFLRGSVEDTPGFGIGSVPTISRERPSTTMERRLFVCASVRRDTISSHLLIGVVRSHALHDGGESQYPVPGMLPNNWPPNGRWTTRYRLRIVRSTKICRHFSTSNHIHGSVRMNSVLTRCCMDGPTNWQLRNYLWPTLLLRPTIINIIFRRSP